MYQKEKFFTPHQKKDSRILVVIIAAYDKEYDEFDQKPYLGLPGLHVRFATQHAKAKYCSTVILSQTGELLDLIVIGNSVTISPVAAKGLKEFLKQNLKDNSTVRFQICNFGDKKIFGEDTIFPQFVVPNSCQLSIPGNWSIISKKNLVALDIKTEIGKDFDTLKGPLNSFLSRKMRTHEEIYKKIEELLEKYEIPKDTVSVKIIDLDNSEKMLTHSFNSNFKI